MRICPGCRAVYDESVQVCEKDGLPLLDVSPTFAAIKANQLPDLAKRPADQTLAEGMMVGEYMIERLIAEGGMGQVFAAIHPVISKRVAVKVLGKHFATDAKAISRFVLEARSVNQIGHHNIVDIFSIGELDDGRNYLIMELLDGLPLHEVLRNVKRFNVGEILPVYEQLCDALEAAHQKSFVHRDLKPDNVIVLRRPPHPFIKILDFGIAKLRDARSETENTEVGTVLGTPEYMAPEQCRGGQIDGRVDIYALGVMLYELVTGRKPFTDPNPLRILSKQMREQPVPPSRLAPIPKALEIVILKAMAKDLEARYGTVREFYDALKAATPEILPWRASLKRPAGGMRQEQVRTIPPESLKHSMSDRAAVALPPRVRRVDVPAPVSISDAIDTTAETDDEEATLVAEPKRVPPAVASRQVSGRKRDPSAVQRPLAPPKGAGALAPMPMSRVSTGELDGVATEIGPVDHVHVDVAAKTPPPALGSVSSGELDTAVTVVEDDEPVMLVDRPVADVMGASEMVQDTAGHHISATFLPPSVVTASPVSVGQGGSPRVGRRSTSGQAETSPPPISEISTGDRTNERDLSALPAKGKKKKAGATLPLLSPDSSFFAERPTVEVQTTPPGVSKISKAPAVSSRSLAEPPPLPEATTPLRAPKQAGAPVASFEFVVDVDVDESDGAKTNDLNEQMEMGATLPLEKIDSAMVVAFDPGDQYNLTGPALPRPRGNQPLLSPSSAGALRAGPGEVTLGDIRGVSRAESLRSGSARKPPARGFLERRGVVAALVVGAVLVFVALGTVLYWVVSSG